MIDIEYKLLDSVSEETNNNIQSPIKTIKNEKIDKIARPNFLAASNEGIWWSI